MICNLGVVGSNPTRGSNGRRRIGESQSAWFERTKGKVVPRLISGNDMGVFQSGQMGQTVNLLSFDFGGSNPSAPTSRDVCGNSSVDRALAFQAGGRGFEPRFPLKEHAVIAQW